MISFACIVIIDQTYNIPIKKTMNMYSQNLWVWKKETLKMLSAHYKDSSSIDEKLVDDLIRTKNIANGCFNMR